MSEPQPDLPLTSQFLITREFHSSKEFSIHIEQLALKRRISIIETLLEYCEEKEIEPAAITPFLTSSVRAKIQTEAENRNLLIIKKRGRLPI